MKYTTTFFLTGLAIFFVCMSAAKGQEPTGKSPVKKTIFIMPDGSVLGPGGLDSLQKVWGPGRIAMEHSSEDDDKGIMHIVRITDEMAKQYADAAAKQKAALSSVIGQPAADFTLIDLKGKKWTLSNLKGKIVVLNFWFTSCPPCIQEMPDLNHLTQTYKSGDVVFLALTFNDATHANTFLNAHKFEYTILPGSHDTDVAYNINSWPTSFVIDKQGKIAFASNYNPDIFKEISEVIEKNK